MLQGGRLQAVIEILQDIKTQHRPAVDVLSDWGRAHRFAGSGDRSAIRNSVFDALRQKRSLSYRMNDDTPRALALGVLAFKRMYSIDEIDTFIADAKYAPDALNETERSSIINSSLDGAPNDVRADVPDWLWPAFIEHFSGSAVEEGIALAQRAPIDLRVNTLKVDRAKLLKSLCHLNVEATPFSALGMRIAPDAVRNVNVRSEAAFQRGWCEIQDEGSQIVALLSGARAGQQIVDMCAGAGGKTLVLAAVMQNKGQIYAYDSDKTRFKAIFNRLKTAGVRNVQTLPAGNIQKLQELTGKIDTILIDAPCTGSGVWRRRPEAKWRLSERVMLKHQVVQAELLDQAALLAKQGTSLIYVTCSVLQAENEAQISSFLQRNSNFTPASLQSSDLLSLHPSGASSMQLTPAQHGTDGFFVARLVRC